MRVSVPELETEIARGGMGRVVRGRFEGRPVAVKVLDIEHAAEPAYVKAFRTEVRAMATLHHPGVVGILDLGRFEEGPYAGCPYAVMELGEQNLVASCGQHPWPVVREWLDGILRALAHAHARGIIHRDLKPANVLLRDGRPMLCDFGLARAFEAVALGQHEQPAGTPGYMPDEQRLGRWRDIGPWTDLYAFGKLALDLVALPTGDSVPVPEGFERWVSRLRQPDASDRFRRAADARAGLQALADEATVQLGDLAGLGPVVDSALARTVPYFQDEDVLQPSLPEPAALPEVLVPASPLPVHRPPRARRVELAVLQEVLPAVHADAAQRVWEVVRQAAAGEARILSLGGNDAGTLAFWLCHQLHETGVGTVELALHDDLRGPRTGLSGMLARELRCLDLEAGQALARLERGPHAEDARDLVGMMGPALSGRAQAAVPDRDRRLALVEAFLRRDAEGRLPLLWVDGAAFADEALAFLRWRGERPGPFLGLVTGGVQEGEGLVVEREGGDALTAAVMRAEEAQTPRQGWTRRLQRFLAQPASRFALLAAAVLGAEVDQARWRDLLRRLRIPLDGLLYEALVQAGIAVPVGLAGHAWRFSRPLVREVVLEQGGTQIPRLHRTAALTYPIRPETAVVRARHLICAGDTAEAQDLLASSAEALEERDPWTFEAALAMLEA